MNDTNSTTVLVVEDEFLVALDLAATLEEAGFTVLGPTAEPETAIALVTQNPPDLALLDVNLGSGKTSYEIARHLTGLHIPFAFLSGYQKSQLPEEFQSAIVLSKPVIFRMVEEWIQTLPCGKLISPPTVVP